MKKDVHKKSMASVIIVNWNGLNHLRECLPALELQNFKDFETILVDNNSSDDSIKYIREHHAAVKIIELEDNFGFDIGNIKGYEKSEGKYVVLLNNDTRPRLDWLHELILAASHNEKVGIIGSVMLKWDSMEIDTAGDGCTWAGVGFKMYSGKDYSVLPEKIDAFGACAGAALYKRSMIEDIGFLDNTFFMNLEDVDISYRARIAGYEIEINKRSIVEHRVSASVKKMNSKSTYYASRNIELVWWKNTPRKYMIISILHKIIHLVSAYISSLKSREQNMNYIAGKRDAYRMIIQGKIDRRMIQKKYKGQKLFLSSEIYRLMKKAEIL